MNKTQADYIDEGYGVSVYPAISVWAVDKVGWFWEDCDSIEVRGPYPDFQTAWMAAGTWMLEDV